MHDAFLRLIDQRKQDWRSRSHFAAISSTILRRVLVDALGARGRRRDRHTRLSTLGELAGYDSDHVDVLDLDAALCDFAGIPRRESGEAKIKRLVVKLIGWYQARRDENRVASERALRSRHRVALPINARQGDGFHRSLAVGAQNSV